MTLRLATWNLHGCVGHDGRYAPERVVQVLRELDADVVALQELAWQPGTARDLLQDFGEPLGYRALAGPTLMRGTGPYGNALLTRREVLDLERIDLGLPGREPRGAIDLRVQGRRGPLRVIATHLGLRPAERRRQADALLAPRLAREAPVEVLLGDLNEWLPWGRPLRRLRRHYGAAPAPATFPARWPLLALDRVWVRPRDRLRALSRHDSMLARVASDHLPLLALVDA